MNEHDDKNIILINNLVKNPTADISRIMQSNYQKRNKADRMSKLKPKHFDLENEALSDPHFRKMPHNAIPTHPNHFTDRHDLL